jgi:site-specific DNA recombinase
MFINADDVEAFVLDACFERLDTPELAAALAGVNAEDPEAERWQQETDQAQGQLEELAAAYGRREITMGEYRVAREPIEQRRSAARKQLAKATRVTVLEGYVGNADALREQWASLDLTRQHAIISAILDHVEVGPARQGFNRFDESRLRPVWRL